MVPYQEPEYLPWDGRRVPLTFLGGYLGAGKTTMLNELLASSDRPIAVMVNDAGAVNIDARLIKKRSGDTIELTDGCVCCTMVDGFGVAFDQIRARETPPDHLIVELSGLADPNRVVPWGKTAGFMLDGVVILVDVEVFDELVDDPSYGIAYRTQLEAADLLVATKTDLVDADVVEGVRQRLAEIVPDTPFVSAPDAVASASFIALGGRRDRDPVDVPPATLFDSHETTTMPIARPITLEALTEQLEGLADNVVRAKGIAEHPDGSRSLIQVVGRRSAVTRLPMSELSEPTDLVVISVRN